MAMMVRAAALAAALMATAVPAMAAASDGFAAFWQAFSVALTKDDQAALAKMVVLSDRLNQAPGLTFTKFHHDYLGPKTRSCLARQKPVRDVDGTGAVNYSAFCGQLDYVFTREGGAWKLTDIGPND
jgi:outer membrane protein W